MSEHNNNNSSIRFFENFSINQQGDKAVGNDPKPFGLEFQENCPSVGQAELKNGISMMQSPTNTPGGPDSCLDID